ncbi:MAG TPA: hypothetical protein VJT50_07165 [Pyrinomonadaceae bacterium]|nr:hypothetical protein [Pyrinomonadaceae bacterium]
MQRLRNISLMVAIILWATLLGGIVYSHIVFFPIYLSALPDSANLVHGPYALNDSSFWVLLHPLTILMLVLTLILNWSVKRRRVLIAISCAVYALAIIATALYFVPELRAFLASPESSVSRAEWFARGQRWQHLSWVRGVFMYLAFIPLLLAWRESSRA